ncbi:hypothetical protein [Fictibacillus sp. NRS-1165]|uniref:hypothetical protein n=1 Tax=Fictibacillus sp. NRS-1165 TaxID=3144463 RepID=UPI003D1AD3C5
MLNINNNININNDKDNDIYKYDARGRLEYHPDIHPNQGKAWTMNDLEYLCKFYEHDGVRLMAAALGRTEPSVVYCAESLKKKMDEKTGKSMFDLYREMNLNYIEIRRD